MATGLHPDAMYGDWTAIHVAAFLGRVDFLEAMLEVNKSVDAADTHGRTALHLAAYLGHAAFVDALLKAKANVRAEDSHGRTPLHRAALSSKCVVLSVSGVAVCAHHPCIASLLAAGADIDGRDKGGWTALHYACYALRSSAATLVAAGADLEARDDDGLTPMQHAVREGRPEVAILLAAAGADPGADPPAHVAAAARARLAALQPGAVAAVRARVASIGEPPDIIAEAFAMMELGASEPFAMMELRASAPHVTRTSLDLSLADFPTAAVPAEVMALMRAEAEAPRIAAAYSAFREDFIKKLQDAKNGGSLACVDYAVVSACGREIAYRASAAAVPNALAALEAARLRQQGLVQTRLR